MMVEEQDGEPFSGLRCPSPCLRETLVTNGCDCRKKKTGSLKLMSFVFLCCCPPYLRWNLSLNSELMISQTPLPVNLWNLPLATAQCWHYRHMPPHLAIFFNLAAADLNSCSQACTTSTLPTQQSLQPKDLKDLQTPAGRVQKLCGQSQAFLQA